MNDGKGLAARGFGVPNEIDPHHFTVEIPSGRAGEVVIVEHFGLQGGSNGVPESVERCRMPRAAWSAVAEEAKRLLNDRLREKKLPTSRWSVGRNPVERLLGKELCVLAWAVERADVALIPAAIRSWQALRPEERWWLFAMAAAATGTAEDADIGWRKAIRIALTENPAQHEADAVRTSRSKRTPPDRPSLPLFDKL